MRDTGKLRLRLAAPLLAALVACNAQDVDSAGQGGQVAEQDLPAAFSSRDAKLQSMVHAAQADLVMRLELSKSANVEVVSAERVTWRSGALGCPMPDRGYTMVLTPGVRIILRFDGKDYEYHGNPAGAPFLCEPPGRIETPAPSSNSLDPT